MNYLAHAYLSFDNAGILTGNMISDFIKGKKQFDYPPIIQKGIQLHRAIDEFTDTHECTHELKKLFQPHYRLYSGPLVDIVYDYFLANDRRQFENDDALMAFSLNCYEQLSMNSEWFEKRFAMMFPYMESHNWLYNYQFEEGIQKSFEGMRRRSAYLSETAVAFQLFKDHRNDMRPIYDLFIRDVKIFARSKMDQLLKD